MIPIGLFLRLLGSHTPVCLPQTGKTETPNYQFFTDYILTSSAYWQSRGYSNMVEIDFNEPISPKAYFTKFILQSLFQRSLTRKANLSSASPPPLPPNQRKVSFQHLLPHSQSLLFHQFPSQTLWPH